MEQNAPVVLVVPPFASAQFPAIGVSVLAAACRARGIGTRVVYANLAFAARVGAGTYERLFRSTAGELCGESVFRAAAFPGSAPAPLPEEEDVHACVPRVEEFLARTVAEILARGPRIVGFSSVFQQNLASLALAREVKRRAPLVTTVLGGANAARPMGPALADVTDAFDFVFSGEADEAFPRFCEDLLGGGPPPVSRVVDCPPVGVLDEVATPEYGDYFEQLAPLIERGLLPDSFPVCIHFETSRGCWWGEHSHCTFCGLNGLEMRYRSKSPARILKEVEQHVARTGVRTLNATDNIMPASFSRTVLPQLARLGLAAEFFYEVKANLRGRDLDALVLAGVHSIQPGIESFSSNVLRALAKGVQGVHNLRLLRDCGSRAIRVTWNLLVGAHGETREDYEATLRLLPWIEHFQPPGGVNRIRIDRYSPLASFPERHGIGGLEPLPAYGRLYPEGTRLTDIAYHFVSPDPDPSLEQGDWPGALEQAVTTWRARWHGDALPPKLAAVPLETGAWYVEDTRTCAAAPVHLLPPPSAQLLERLEQPRVAGRLSERERQILSELRAAGFVVEHEGRVLSVVTRPMLGLELHRAFDAASERKPEAELTG